MDESAPKEVTDAHPADKDKVTWDTWYRVARENVISTKASIKTQIGLLEGVEPQTTNIPIYASALMASTVNVLKHSMTIYDDLKIILEGLNFQWQQLSSLESNMNTKVRVLEEAARGTRSDLDAEIATTAKTLSTVNDFVTHFKPLLEELENERPIRNKTLGRK
ncbi:MAG: hypothetical protein ABSF82_07855 [Candidatus Bathyarchaeia archaeon]|jgi:hypothetical protein